MTLSWDLYFICKQPVALFLWFIDCISLLVLTMFRLQNVNGKSQHVTFVIIGSTLCPHAHTLVKLSFQS